MKITDVEFILSVANLTQLPKDRLGEVAFAGRSNVGKSSLINCLLNRKKMAKISSKPGKTRLINYFRVNKKYYFVDLPGYGYAKVSKSERDKWQKLIGDYIEESENLRVVVSIVDSKVGPTPLDIQLLGWLKEIGKPIIIVATKADKLTQSSRAKQLKSFGETLKSFTDGDIQFFSAVKGLGKKELTGTIQNYLEQL